MDHIAPGVRSREKPKELPSWERFNPYGKTKYDVALRLLQNALATNDQDGIKMMHSILSQLGAQSITLDGSQDYHQVTKHNHLLSLRGTCLEVYLLR